MTRSFIRIRPRADQLYVSQGRMVMATNPEGFIDGLSQEGLFVHETRLLSKHRATVAGERPRPVALSKVEQHSWMGYYVVAPPGLEVEEADMGSGVMEEVSEQTIELRLSRFAGANLHEDLDLTNFSSRFMEFELAIELDADFADQIETYRPRRQHGELRQDWERVEEGRWALRYRYQASHDNAELRRGLDVFVHRCDSPPRWQDGRLVFDVSLRPHQRWHSCIDYVPVLEKEALDPPEGRSYYQCRSFEPTDNPMTHGTRRHEYRRLSGTPGVDGHTAAYRTRPQQDGEDPTGDGAGRPSEASGEETRPMSAPPPAYHPSRSAREIALHRRSVRSRAVEALSGPLWRAPTDDAPPRAGPGSRQPRRPHGRWPKPDRHRRGVDLRAGNKALGQVSPEARRRSGGRRWTRRLVGRATAAVRRWGADRGGAERSNAPA